MHAETEQGPLGLVTNSLLIFWPRTGVRQQRGRGQPWVFVPSQSWEKQLLLSWGPGGLWRWCLALELAGNLLWQISAAVQVVNMV